MCGFSAGRSAPRSVSSHGSERRLLAIFSSSVFMPNTACCTRQRIVSMSRNSLSMDCSQGAVTKEVSHCMAKSTTENQMTCALGIHRCLQVWVNSVA